MWQGFKKKKKLYKGLYIALSSYGTNTSVQHDRPLQATSSSLSIVTTMINTFTYKSNKNK
jgi:hypothetical protein